MTHHSSLSWQEQTGLEDAEFFDDGAIRGSFIQAHDVGDPAASGSAWCYTHIKCDVFSRPADVGIVKGGMGTITQALAASIQTLGVTIQTNAVVERVSIENGQAVGICLEDGVDITSRIVVSNADPKRTLLKLVGDEHLPSDFVRKVTRLKTNTCWIPHCDDWQMASRPRIAEHPQ